MYILIRTEIGGTIRAELIKVKNTELFYKLNLGDYSEKWKSIPSSQVKSFSIKDHRSNHPGNF